MIKKCGILMLSLLILFVVPANAVQIGSQEESFNLNSGNEIKNFEIKDILLNNNEAADIKGTIYNKTTDLNSTVGNCTNGTFVNETTDLNSTVGNCTNGTFVNGTDVNGTVGNDTNGTVDEEKLKEQKQKLKENIISTLNIVSASSIVFTGVCLAIAAVLISIPEPSVLTKVLGLGFGIATVAGCAVSIGCVVAAVFVQWWM
jgi:hypothetical protein